MSCEYPGGRSLRRAPWGRQSIQEGGSRATQKLFSLFLSFSPSIHRKEEKGSRDAQLCVSRQVGDTSGGLPVRMGHTHRKHIRRIMLG